MKIQIKFLVVTAILCFATVITKAEKFSIKVAGNHSFILKLSDINTDQIVVRLDDSKGISVYEENLSMEKPIRRKYDLHELPEGTYHLFVIYNKITKVQTIEKTYEMLDISSDDQQTIFQPIFRQHEQFLDMDMLCLSEMNVSISIHDSQGNIIYDESSDKYHGSFAKRFNLSLLSGGSYSFTVSVQNGQVQKNFSEIVEWAPALSSL